MTAFIDSSSNYSECTSFNIFLSYKSIKIFFRVNLLLMNIHLIYLILFSDKYIIIDLIRYYKIYTFNVRFQNNCNLFKFYLRY